MVRVVDHLRDALYRQLLDVGVQYFIPTAAVEVVAETETSNPVIAMRPSPPGTLEFEWLGLTYRIQSGPQEFTDDQMRIIDSIGRVLSMRYQLAANPELAPKSAHLFRGLPEDRYVSAFLDCSSYRDAATTAHRCDRTADAIEVLRLAAMTTCENRRISTGLILFGTGPDEAHLVPAPPGGALRYSADLTATRSFYRLSDALRTVLLVDPSGFVIEVIDLEEWSAPFRDVGLPAPVAARYEFHSRATLFGGHVCMILTVNGEIKVFSGGSQVFTFRDGRWHLANMAHCYDVWRRGIGNRNIAERLFTVALNLAEDRRGALFVVLDDASLATRLVSTRDLLTEDAQPQSRDSVIKYRFHYLLRDQDAMKLSPAVLETVARMDGAIVLDSDANLLCFGAILHNAVDATTETEGGRTTAAIAASRYGSVLKVSEDGMISYYRGGKHIWDI